MRTTVIYLILFAAALLTLPMIALPGVTRTDKTEPAIHRPIMPRTPDIRSSPPGPSDPGKEDTADTPMPSIWHDVSTLKIFDLSTGIVQEVPLRDYVRGAVAAEMPALFHPEALKAQAVAAHTYALYNYHLQQNNPDPELKGAAFSADPSNRKGYMTEAQAKNFYGPEYGDLYWKKVCDAADSVLDYVLISDGEPIVAAYHAISAGQTESAGNVWSGNVPYLIPAVSEGDILAPGYETTANFAQDELYTALTTAFPGLMLSADPEDWIAIEERSNSGYALCVRAGAERFHGKEIRTALGLRSHAFDLSYSDAGFLFTVHGYGHGVGLSQYGADYMARQGGTFDEILVHYYSGASLVSGSIE